MLLTSEHQYTIDLTNCYLCNNKTGRRQVADSAIRNPQSEIYNLLPVVTLAQQCADEQRLQLEGKACYRAVTPCTRRSFSRSVDRLRRPFGRRAAELLGLQAAARYGLPEPDTDELADIRSDGLARFVERYASRFSSNFEHIGAALSVLQKCIASCLQDRQRSRQRALKLNHALEQEAIDHERGDLTLLGRMELEELRHCIQELLYNDVPEAHLRLLIELRFQLDLSRTRSRPMLPNISQPSIMSMIKLIACSNDSGVGSIFIRSAVYET